MLQNKTKTNVNILVSRFSYGRACLFLFEVLDTDTLVFHNAMGPITELYNSELHTTRFFLHQSIFIMEQ